MIWVLVVVVAVLIIAAFLALLAGRLPYDGLSDPVHSTPPIDLPAEADPDDVAALHFDTALRGYRMDQVDEALNTLQKRIAVLEEQVGPSAPAAPTTAPPSAAPTTAPPSTAPTTAASTTAATPTTSDQRHVARHSRRED